MFLFSIIYICSIHYFLRSWYRWTTSSPLPFSSSCCYWCHSFILSISGHHPWHRHKSHLIFIFFAKPIWSSPRDAHHDTHGWTNGVLSSSGLCLPHQTWSLVPSSGLGEYSAEHGRWMDPNTDTRTLKIKQLTDQIYKYIYPCFLSLDRTSDKCSVPIDANGRTWPHTDFFLKDLVWDYKLANKRVIN